MTDNRRKRAEEIFQRAMERPIAERARIAALTGTPAQRSDTRKYDHSLRLNERSTVLLCADAESRFNLPISCLAVHRSISRDGYITSTPQHTTDGVFGRHRYGILTTQLANNRGGAPL